MFEKILDAFLDAGLDCLKIFAILYLVYLLVEYFTHKKEEAFVKLVSKNNKTGPLIGAVLGCVPQCGFSAVMADMFNHKLISIGTLIAVFVATSDEAIPILLSYPNKILDILILIGIKLVIALIFGYLFNLIFSVRNKVKHKNNNFENMSANVNSIEYLEHHDCKIDEHHLHHHTHEHELNEPCDCCSDNIFLSALKHSLIITLYVFVANLIINLVFVFVGEEVLINALMVSPVLQIIIAPLIGLIPNCVSSVALIELYLNGALIFPALIGGLSAGSGVGLILLFKNHKNIKQNIFIMFSLYLIGLAVGFILSLFL